MTIKPKVEVSTTFRLMIREYYISAPFRGKNTQVIKMKCKICEKKIKVGELVHEVPNKDGELNQLCGHCYTAIYRMWEV